jgi:hypothetical protein
LQRAFKTLLYHGIDPDFVVVSDPYEVAYNHINNLAHPRTTLIAGVGCDPRIWELGVEKWRCSPNGAASEWAMQILGDRRLLTPGGSVAHTAAELASIWECDSIHLVGIDECLGPDGEFYYDRGVVVKLEGQETIEYEGRLTTEAMAKFAIWFRRMRIPRLVNHSGGLSLGCEEQPVEALAELNGVDPFYTHAHLIGPGSKRKAALNSMVLLRRRLLKLKYAAINAIKTSTRKTITLNDRIFNGQASKLPIVSVYARQEIEQVISGNDIEAVYSTVKAACDELVALLDKGIRMF